MKINSNSGPGTQSDVINFHFVKEGEFTKISFQGLRDKISFLSHSDWKNGKKKKERKHEKWKEIIQFLPFYEIIMHEESLKNRVTLHFPHVRIIKFVNIQHIQNIFSRRFVVKPDKMKKKKRKRKMVAIFQYSCLNE